jgi:hypothetical protein
MAVSQIAAPDDYDKTNSEILNGAGLTETEAYTYFLLIRDLSLVLLVPGFAVLQGRYKYPIGIASTPLDSESKDFEKHNTPPCPTGTLSLSNMENPLKFMFWIDAVFLISIGYNVPLSSISRSISRLSLSR